MPGESDMQLERPFDELLETEAHVRVLRALAGLPRGFAASARDLARRAGVAHTTAARVLRTLAEYRLVRAQHVGRAYLYELNDGHVLASQIRALFQSEAGVRTQLIEYLRAELPQRVGRAEGAFLFGSAGRSDTRPGSDIDVAVVAPERSDEELEPALAALSDSVRDRFGAELNVILGPSGRSRRPRPKLWQRIEREGVPLLAQASKRG